MPASSPPPPDAIDAVASSMAALGDPTRRRLYRHVAGALEPVSREQAAEALGVPAHTVKFHLDRLVDEGLLDVEYRRLTGRSGPGAGRPAKLYRRSGRELSLSLPERHYDLLSAILARSVEAAVAEGAPVDQVASRVARDAGRSIGATAAGSTPTGDSLDRLAVSLAPHGYEPRVADDRMVLENCPFDKVARDHIALVCGLNLELVSGAIEGLGCSDLDVSLRPTEGRCCVSATRR